ncbi:protein-lysine N-methyltransferase [Pyrofollis japonicus]|uniref:tRNA (adenine(22)-N(1))-methyltransferase TrmK n=1 Tax=Pyrofollis japonicus TaxID=3060460 RepID=UPI00295A58FA|nr:tRNA (adenine(22)-N(1))-methyltransferase TrmK [Pyrofollis japonicus]BEP17563.1 protein-lysine N-methyltransferase [Pyrofollis japonicus]
MNSVLVPFVPTPIYVARKMLELAGAQEDDVVIDLGCGDGRIPIIAVKEFNVKRAICVEIQRHLAEQARENVHKLGLDDKIEIINDDMFKVNISEASIVTLFLLTSVNDALASKLREELRVGTRIVSHEFRITKWEPIIFSTVNDGRVSHNLYLYIIGYSDK